MENRKTQDSVPRNAFRGGGKDVVAPWEVNWNEALALLVGNEGAGLPEEVVKAADARVHVPMARDIESLNAAAATAVVLYEAFRQRRKAAASDA